MNTCVYLEPLFLYLSDIISVKFTTNIVPWNKGTSFCLVWLVIAQCLVCWFAGH